MGSTPAPGVANGAPAVRKAFLATGTREYSQTSGSAPAAAFTLIEIMIAMVLMSVIVLGLMAMFNETQRAFRLGTTQTDVLEAGRMATDMIGRELEQCTPSDVDRSFGASPNFYAGALEFSTQSLPGTETWRTNVLEDVFFLTRQNQTVTGIGYFVRTNLVSPAPGFYGTLYRFETNNSVRQFEQNPNGMYDAFNYVRGGRSRDNKSVSKILDGVVDFRVRAYDTNGFWIGGTNSDRYTRPYISTNGNIRLAGDIAGEVGNYFFFSNAVPVSVEFQLGVLEQQTLDQLRSIPVPAAQIRYYTNQASRVHLFRQQIRIRNADPTAYQGVQ